MIKIKKNNPPAGLEKLREEAERKQYDANEAFRSLKNPLKEEVRRSLVVEQGHLCAYCMRRIPDERIEETGNPAVYIEHWSARNPEDGCGAGGALDYFNLLAVCSGNQYDRSSKGKNRLTCDAKRENRSLKVNPLDEKTLETIYYTEDGLIGASDKEIADDLTVKLNLNCKVDAVSLPHNRMEALRPVQEELVELAEEEILDYCREILYEYENETDPKTPYSGIVIWYLKDMINSLEK